MYSAFSPNSLTVVRNGILSNRSLEISAGLILLAKCHEPVSNYSLPDRVTKIVLKINSTVGNLTSRSGNVFNARYLLSLGDSFYVLLF